MPSRPARSPSSVRSSLDPRPQEQGRPEEPPPVPKPAHLRVPLSGVVHDRARNLDRLVPESDRFVQEIGLRVVAREPVLIDVDLRIAEKIRAEDPEAVG